MKRFFAPVVLALAVALTTARAESPEDQYVRIYNVIQAGDSLGDSDQSSAALNRYLEAQASLQQFQKVYPEWTPKVVNYRLNYLASKVAALAAKSPGFSAPVKPAPRTRPVTPLPAEPVATPPPAPALAANAELEARFAALAEDVRRLQSDKSLLEAKLKEALSAQPAAVDPRELAKAREQIHSLMKENDLLKTTTAAEKPRTIPAAELRALDDTKHALAEANRKLTEQIERANTLANEKKILQSQLDAQAANADSAAKLETTRKALDDANRKLAEQSGLTKQLAVEKETLQARIKSLTMSADASEALRAENDVLKKQLAQARSAGADATKSSEAAAKLSKAEAQIAALQSDAEILRLEKTALENRVRTLAAQKVAAPVVATPAPPPASRREDLARIKLLENERDDLARKLDSANKELYGRKGKVASTRIDELNSQITTLRARLEVFEARAVPYTVEELALFKPSPARLAAANPNAGKKGISSLPSGVETLVATAQRHFAAKEFDQAEANYLEILRRDEKNAYTLANLAAIQLERGRLDEAEKSVKAALAGAPEDAYSLSILGYVKFRQEKYDDALDALSRAARMNPSSAEIQNYLGVTLSHKGLRGPAETALRKAIQIDPGYGSAHNNLAVIYATQNPPLLELARWHYDRALTAGHPRNADLEKMFDAKAATAAASP